MCRAGGWRGHEPRLVSWSRRLDKWRRRARRAVNGVCPSVAGRGRARRCLPRGRRGGVGLDAAGTFLGVSRPEGPWRVFVGSLPGLTPARHPHPADSPRGRGTRLALQDERRIERRCVTATRDGSGAAHLARPPPGAAAGGRGRARAPCTWSTSGGSPEGRDTPGVAARKTSHLPPAHTFFFLFSDDVFY